MSSIRASIYIYHLATSLGRPPFCNCRASPSSEQLPGKMWLHQFLYYFATYHMSGRNNMRYKYRNTTGFVLAYACRVCDTLRVGCATVH